MEWIAVAAVFILFVGMFIRLAVKTKPKKKITRKELYSKTW